MDRKICEICLKSCSLIWLHCLLFTLPPKFAESGASPSAPCEDVAASLWARSSRTLSFKMFGPRPSALFRQTLQSEHRLLAEHSELLGIAHMLLKAWVEEGHSHIADPVLDWLLILNALSLVHWKNIYSS